MTPSSRIANNLGHGSKPNRAPAECLSLGEWCPGGDVTCPCELSWAAGGGLHHAWQPRVGGLLRPWPPASHTSTHLALPKLLGVVFCSFNLALDTYCVPGRCKLRGVKQSTVFRNLNVSNAHAPHACGRLCFMAAPGRQSTVRATTPWYFRLFALAHGFL